MKSIWKQTVEMQDRPRLEGDIRADVCVIGAGISGINCAYRLKQAGLRVVVLEANRAGCGTTGNTTAKITAQHDLIYDTLARTFGSDITGAYARANAAAIEDYAAIIKKEDIDCDFERADHLVYAIKDPRALEPELKAMRAAGLDAFLTDKTELPFPVAGAVGIKKQAHFHPMKYLRALIDKLDVYEHSRVLEAKEGFVRVEGGSVRCDHIVVCTRFPFIDVPGWYFLRMHQERSVAAALEGASKIQNMYIDMADGGLSFRPHRGMLIMGSGSWRTGENPGGQFAALTQKEKEYYPDAREVAAWSAEDCVTQDRLPFIGHYAGSTPRMYVMTGFGKWGMTLSMAGATLITDLILERKNEAEAAFSPQRAPVHGLKGLKDDVKESIKGFARHILPPEELTRDIPNGEARVVELEGQKLGAYRDEHGEIHAVHLTCPHLGCMLKWNPDDKSWDCPCHGSRFDIDGRLLDGPAQRDIHKEESD